MSAVETKLFKLLDHYSRARQKCFLAEMFLDESEEEYVLCFRPADARIDSPNRYACRYLRILAEEASAIAKEGVLSVDVVEMMDAELPSLRECGTTVSA
jgi:hypothetical protein